MGRTHSGAPLFFGVVAFAWMDPLDVDAAHARLNDYLQRHGLKQTRQRDAILEAFLGSSGHITSEQLYEIVRDRHPDVGAATVYRTLRLLCDAGLANSHQFGEGVTLYEVEGRHHDHLICNDCGAILEFHNELVEVEQEKIAAQQGFKLTKHQHILFGNCQDPDCSRRKTRS